MIRQTEQPAPETASLQMLAGYRLDDSPRQREGGSLLFAATAPDGARAALQVSANPVSSPGGEACFRRLAQARAEVGHPALLRVREIGEEGGRVFAATEPFPSRSLADLLRAGPLEPALAVKLLTAVADGLDAAHAAGVVHRTLSAESVLLDGDLVKLDMFGVFTVPGLTSSGDVRRDPYLHYESPEGVRGEELIPASNVYSLTGLLIHALTGTQPFGHLDPELISWAHLTLKPRRPTELKPELPSAIDAIVAHGLTKDPAARPESAGALVAAAATVLCADSRPAPAPSTAPVPRAANGTAAAPTSSDDAAPARRGAGGAGAAPEPQRSAVSLVAAYVAPAPATPASRPNDAGRAPVETQPPARPRGPRSAWLGPFEPVLLVFVVAALAGALLGLPGGGSKPAATVEVSPEQPAVQRLDEVRFRLRDDLAFATTADEQADAAQRLAMAYGRAADHMGSAALVSAARDASIAYLAVESAARAGDQDAYDSARSQVESAEERIERELARINRSRAPE
jgi:hypothetical protein